MRMHELMKIKEIIRELEKSAGKINTAGKILKLSNMQIIKK